MQKSFFFAILFVAAVSAASVSIPLAFAEEPLASIRFKDRLVEHLPDGSTRETFGMVPYVQDGNDWVDRKISNNGTHFNVHSEMGSFSFNKADCTITQYVKGFDPITKTAHGSDIMIGDWFWTIARKNGANPWEVIDPMIFGCTISTFQNSTGKYLEMTRTHQSTGSYLKVTLAAKTDMPVEDYTELYMNVPAWSGNKFAFVLWAKDVNTDTLTYRNGTTIQIPQGITTIDRSQLTVESMNFIKNGNAFFFDWQKAADKFKTLLLNKTGTNLDVQFGFNNNAVTLNTGQKMYLDPTYGYQVVSESYRLATNAIGGASCSPTYNAQVADVQLFLASNAVQSCYVPLFSWNISTIPDGSTITAASIEYDVTAASGGGGFVNCKWRNVTTNSTGQAMLTEIMTSGTVLADNDATCASIGNDKTLTLNANATSAIQAQLVGNFFNIGVQAQTPVRDATDRGSIFRDNDARLSITYLAIPPNAITDLHATDFGVDSADLAFSAPNMQGGTLQVYVFNYTTPCGIPLTVLPNGTTATSYTVSGLAAATCYSFRASAATEAGFNATGNIVNVTTLAFNEANYTIGSFNFQATNPNIFPIRYERIDSGTQTRVNVTFTNTFNMACDLSYTYAQTNHTYHTISSIPVSASEDEASFNFLNSTNDIVTFHCWNQAGNQSANYVMTQTDFLLKQQVRDFRNGTYGTMGQFGAFDFITLIVVIIAMIGLNHKTEAVGGFFAIIAVAVLAYFEIVAWYTAIIAGLAVIILLAISSTRKD